MILAADSNTDYWSARAASEDLSGISGKLPKPLLVLRGLVGKFMEWLILTLGDPQNFRP
jgi:hypothetical protein